MTSSWLVRLHLRRPEDEEAGAPRSVPRRIVRFLLLVLATAGVGVLLAVAIAFYTGLSVGVEVALVAFVVAAVIVGFWPRYR